MTKVPEDVLLIQNYCSVGKTLQIKDARQFDGGKTQWKKCIKDFVQLISKLRSLEKTDASVQTLFHQTWRTLDRLSRSNPIEEMRTVLRVIRDKMLLFGYAPNLQPCKHSLFIKAEEFPTADLVNNELWIKVFLDFHGRITAWHQALAYDTSILEKHVSTHHFIMHDESGVLPCPWRHYLALMAAARHKCDYLVRLEGCLFLACGGDVEWLIDASVLPEKLKRFEFMLSLLAHHPWDISSSSFHVLTRGVQPWTIAELCHAVVIITHYNALSSFCWGIGLSCEDFEDLGSMPLYSDQEECLNELNETKCEHRRTTPSPQSLGDTESRHRQGDGRDARDGATDTTARPIQIVPSVHATSESSATTVGKNIQTAPGIESGELWNESDKDKSSESKNQIESKIGDKSSREIIEHECAEHAKELIDLFNVISSDSNWMESKFEEKTMKKRKVDEAALKEVMNQYPRLGPSVSDRFVEDDVVYENFPFNRSSRRIMRLQGYSLDDSSIVMLDCYYPKVSQHLSEEMENLYSTINLRLGENQIRSTKPLLYALYHYAQRLYGIQYDEFNQHLVNKFMTLGQKMFIKKMLCYPERVIHCDFSRLLALFNMEDSVYYAYFACQARKFATLSLVLHAMAESMT